MAIRVSRASAATVSFSTPQEIVISHADDSIRLGDGSNLVTSTSQSGKRGLDVYVTNPSGASAGELVNIDESVSGTTYFGFAAIGSDNGDAVWKIKKMVLISGVSEIKYADGNEDYDNIWDNRASLTYS